MKSTDSVSTTGTTNTFTYVIHPDGSIAIPVDTGEGGSFKLTSGGLAWPTPAQIASGKPQDDTLTMSGTESGKSVNITAHAVFTGEGTQSVTVPAGSYTATVIDETETEKILGYPSTFNIKTWLVSGVGPVKEEMTSTMDGSSMLDQQEELTSFVKG